MRELFPLWFRLDVSRLNKTKISVDLSGAMMYYNNVERR